MDKIKAYLYRPATSVSPSPPKVFEIGDVLPATSRLQITYAPYDESDGSVLFSDKYILFSFVKGSYDIDFTFYDSNAVVTEIDDSTYELDLTNVSLTYRTVTYVGGEVGEWQDLVSVHPATMTPVKPYLYRPATGKAPLTAYFKKED